MDKSTVSRWESGFLDPGVHATPYRQVLEQLEDDSLRRVELMLVILRWFDQGKPDLREFCARVDAAGSLEAADVI